MKKYINKKIKHPYVKDGYWLICRNRTWSCVNLSRPSELDSSENMGSLLDNLGGRFEAMLVDKDGINPDHCIRSHSFEGLFKKVKEYNEFLDSQLN